MINNKKSSFIEDFCIYIKYNSNLEMGNKNKKQR